MALPAPRIAVYSGTFDPYTLGHADVVARADRIVSIDFSGPATAFAKVECQIPPRYFTDYLTLLKVDGRWQVIAKAYHTVTRES